MDEHSNEYVGIVYVLPRSHAFELHTTVHGEPLTITGTVAQPLAQQLADHVPGTIGAIDPCQVALRPRRVEVITRELHERHRAPRKVYFLARVHDVEEQGRPVPMSTV
jgi:hypothetical protein